MVLGALSVRSIVFYGVTSFFPLYLVATFGASEDSASLLITVFSICGACATALSGFVVRRIETPKLMVACFALMAVALIVFVLSDNVWLCVVAVMVLALCVNMFNPPAIALGQSYLPAHLGMASGLSFGVAVAVGGIASPLLGVLGDATGLVPVIWILVLCAIIGLVCSGCCVQRKPLERPAVWAPSLSASIVMAVLPFLRGLPLGTTIRMFPPMKLNKPRLLQCPARQLPFCK